MTAIRLPGPERALTDSFRSIGIVRVVIGALLVIFPLSVPADPEHQLRLTVGSLIGVLAMALGAVQWHPRYRRSFRFARMALVLDTIGTAAYLADIRFDPNVFALILVFPLVIQGAIILGRPGALIPYALVIGTYLWIEFGTVLDQAVAVIALRVGISGGMTVLIGSVAEDVRRERDELRSQERLFRLVTEESADVVTLMQIDGTITYSSPATLALFERGPDEYMGHPIHEFIHPDDLPIVAAALLQAASEPDARATVEVRVAHADGSWIWVEARAVNLLHDPVVDAIVVSSRDITDRKAAEASLAERTNALRNAADERRRLLGRTLELQEEERARVADALHDGPLQQLTAAAMRLDLLKETSARATNGEPEETVADAAARLVSRSIEQIRRVMLPLRSVPLERLGLAAALREFVTELGADDSLVFIEDRLAREPAPDIGLAAFRIAQEALSLAVSTPETKEIEVTLDSAAGGLQVEVKQRGRGPDVASSRLVLAGMRERAELAGGRWWLESVPGEGTTIGFWLPAA